MIRDYYNFEDGSEATLTSSNHNDSQLYFRISQPRYPTEMLEADSLHCSQALKVKNLKKSRKNDSSKYPTCSKSIRGSKRNVIEKEVPGYLLEADSLHCSKIKCEKRSSKRSSAKQSPPDFMEADSLHHSRARMNKGKEIQPTSHIIGEDSESEFSFEDRDSICIGNGTSFKHHHVAPPSDLMEADSLHCNRVKAFHRKIVRSPGKSESKRRSARRSSPKREMTNGLLEADSLHCSKARILKEKGGNGSFNVINKESQSSAADSDSDSVAFEFDGIRALGNAHGNVMANRLQMIRQASLSSLSSFANASSHHQSYLPNFEETDDDESSEVSMEFDY